MNPLDAKAFLDGMASTDPAVRQEALKSLPQQDAAVLPGLADLMGSADPAVAKAAKTAMERLVHLRLAPPAGTDRPGDIARATFADGLLEIARSPRPRLTRAHALHLAGFAGDRRHEKALGALEKDPQVGEDARMARQRIRSVRY
jgi:hypothetical protein